MGGRGSGFGGGGGRSVSMLLGKRGRPQTIAFARAHTNPHFGEGEEWRNNCQRCAYTYELQRRGYNVEAKPAIMDGDDAPRANWRHIMENQTWKSVSEAAKMVKRNKGMQSWEKLSPKNIIDQLDASMQEYGNGARAIIYVKWKNADYAHVFNAENIKGKTIYVDAQTHQLVNIHEYVTAADKDMVYISRVDNLKPTKLIGDYVRKAGD